MSENGAKALETLTPPVLGKRAALDRLLGQARLAIGRGCTVAEVSDCLLESGVRISPDQLRSYLATGKAKGRPPVTVASLQGAGPVSALVPVPGKRGRPKGI